MVNSRTPERNGCRFADTRKRVVKMPPLFWPGRWEEEPRKMAKLWESGLDLSKVTLSCAVNILKTQNSRPPQNIWC